MFGQPTHGLPPIIVVSYNSQLKCSNASVTLIIRMKGGQDVPRCRLATGRILLHFPQICITFYVNEARRHTPGTQFCRLFFSPAGVNRKPTEFCSVCPSHNGNVLKISQYDKSSSSRYVYGNLHIELLHNKL